LMSVKIVKVEIIEKRLQDIGSWGVKQNVILSWASCLKHRYLEPQFSFRTPCSPRCRTRGICRVGLVFGGLGILKSFRPWKSSASRSPGRCRRRRPGDVGERSKCETFSRYDSAVLFLISIFT